MEIITLNYITEAGVSLNSRLYVPKLSDDVADASAAVLMFPEWWGLTDHVQNRAKLLAEQGYVVLAVDMYGEGRVTHDATVANKRMMELLENPCLLNERVQLAYNNLRAVAEVNPNKIAAMGYCFGGRVVLDMAREGVDLRAVVSFHGLTQTAHPATEGAIKAAVLVEHGALDSMCTLADIEVFRAEMEAAKAVYHVDILPDAKHGFTNPEATENGKRNGADLAYNETAANLAWQNALNWLARWFAD